MRRSEILSKISHAASLLEEVRSAMQLEEQKKVQLDGRPRVALKVWAGTEVGPITMDQAIGACGSNDRRKVAATLIALGWERRRAVEGGKRVWKYFRLISQ